jgi:hypothetical protein
MSDHCRWRMNTIPVIVLKLNHFLGFLIFNSIFLKNLEYLSGVSQNETRPGLCSVRLVPMECFSLLFLIVPCHLNYFKTTNEISTMHDFILKFYSTKFYFVSLVINEMK